MLIGVYKDYRQFLNDELLKRRERNAHYSLRAFSRDLKIAPQVLSLVLKGKKGISQNVAINLASALNLSEEETSYFYDLVELAHAKGDSVKSVIQYRLSKYAEIENFRQLHEDSLLVISDWYHFAILELTFTPDFKSDADWIASRLGISLFQAKQALQRLVRLKLLDLVKGRYVKTNVNLTTSNEVESDAIKKITNQYLSKASEAQNEQSLDHRDFSTVTMAIDPKKIPKAKNMITNFRRELMTYLESGEQTEVYVLATQLFKLSFPVKEKGRKK